MLLLSEIVNIHVDIYVMDRTWRWESHLIRSNKEKWSRNMVEWYLRHYMRKKGRQRRRWEDDVKSIAGTTSEKSNKKPRSVEKNAYAGKRNNLRVPVPNK